MLELARAGTEEVTGLLGPDVPRRVCVEAGLQILARDAKPELAVAAGMTLLREFGAVDGSLRLRILRALARVPRGRLASGLDGLIAAQLRTGATPEARAAVELAAARGRWLLLDGILRTAIDRPAADEEIFELAREVAVRRADDGAEALEVGAQFLARCDGRIAAAPAPDLREALSVRAVFLHVRAGSRRTHAGLARRGTRPGTGRPDGPRGCSPSSRARSRRRADPAARLEGRELLRVILRAAEVGASRPSRRWARRCWRRRGMAGDRRPGPGLLGRPEGRRWRPR